MPYADPEVNREYQRVYHRDIGRKARAALKQAQAKAVLEAAAGGPPEVQTSFLQQLNQLAVARDPQRELQRIAREIQGWCMILNVVGPKTTREELAVFIDRTREAYSEKKF